MKKSHLAALLLFTGLCTLGSLSAQTITFNYTGGVVTYTISTTGTYTFTAGGAKGGNSGSGASIGGSGATVQGSITLTSGTIINILVGGLGLNGTAGNNGGGGGGGTFVYTTVGGNTPLLVAGGGGGSGFGGGSGGSGQVTQNGGTSGGGGAGGTGGNGGAGGGAGGGTGGGGAGFNGDGAGGAAGGGGSGPNSFTGGAGGGGGGNGGLGGGGGGGNFSGGGGGGYSGGGGGGIIGADGNAGGGGSFLSSSFFSTTFTAGANALAGYLQLVFGGGSSGLIASNSVTTVSVTQTNPSVTFQTNGVLNITSGGNLTITTNVVVNNNGTVNDNGTFTVSNSVTINPGSTLTGSGILTTPTLINQGVVTMNGLTMNVQSGGVNNTGSLSGVGTINGNLVNSGTLTPGGSVNPTGTLTVNGNFTQTSTGTFILQASSGSRYNSLYVNGSANLSGTIQVSGINGYPLNYGDQYAFLTSTGPIKGSFSAINTPAGYRGRLLIVGDPVAYILIAPASYTQMALNSFIPATSGDQLVVSTALDSLTAGQYQQAFNAIMPTFYQSMSTIAFNLANAQNSELVQRLWGLRVAQGGGFSMSGLPDNTPVIEGQGDGSKGVLDAKKDVLRPGADNHWGLFVDGNGIFAQANSANMLPGYKSQSGGITTGLTYKWNESFGTGLYAGYEGSYAKFGAAGSGLGVGSQLIDNSVRFGLFGTYGQPDGKGFYADALAGGGYNNYQATRIIQFSGLNRTATSSPGAGELDTMLAGGYDFKKGLFTFGPTASLQYTYLGVNPVNEIGAQSLNFSSGGWNSSSMLSSVGAHAAYTWQAGRNVVVVPQISLNW